MAAALLHLSWKHLERLGVLISLLAPLSCTKYSEVIVKDNVMSVAPVAWGLDFSNRRVDWTVGLHFRETMAKGLVLKVKLPQLKSAQIEELRDKKKIDGWLVKATRWGPTTHEQVLGYLYIPFPWASGTEKRPQLEEVFFQINYHQVDIEEKYSWKNCPLHWRKKFPKDIIVETNKGNSSKLMTISASEEEQIESSIVPFSYHTQVFDAGISVIGTYEVQLAFMNFSSKTRRSSFLASPTRVVVAREEERLVEGCNLD
ncbi:MAG: hypothetical protein A2X86_11000 [Bdellovibrionales bacterium GWA2_49_15]|nr:MAG: hypothetical protein A2X86_11000 [Bdellovibrionales bacterium GWA2_49_15]HAZ11504.1 hypothetical protein [Bdellovibrionales bacterium]